MEKDGKGDKQYKTNSRVSDDTEKAKIQRKHKNEDRMQRKHKNEDRMQRKHRKNANTEKT